VNASDAISNVDISTYSKKLKNLSSLVIALANGSYFIHSLSIMPQFKATSWVSYLQRQSNINSLYIQTGHNFVRGFKWAYTGRGGEGVGCIQGAYKLYKTKQFAIK